MKTNHTLLLLAVLSASITIRLAAQSADTTAPPDTIEADTTNMTTIDTVPADTVAPTDATVPADAAAPTDAAAPVPPPPPEESPAPPTVVEQAQKSETTVEPAGSAQNKAPVKSAADTVVPVAPTNELQVLTNDPPPNISGTNSSAGLRLNFRGVPLEMVLDYLSDAAGFIIVLDTPVSGRVDLWSDQPVTKDEAVDLLNSVLNKNGYAAIRDGRKLTIVSKNDAKTRDIPVKSGNDPAAIPSNDEIVTQIIPIRFVEARQLASDLSAFVSPQATIVANEAGNSIVVTDTQSNIRHLMEIIKAVDDSAEAETEIRVFHLRYANPTDVATELGNIFPSGNSGNNLQTPVQFRGGGGGPGGFFARMMAANAGANSQNDRIKKATQVTAVADARIQSVIVTAPKNLMEQIAGMMRDLDVPSQRDQKVYVFHMNNGDPQEAAQVLQNMFQSSTSSRSSTSSSSQNSPLMQRAQNNASSSSSSVSGSSSSSGFGGTGTGTGMGTGRAF